MLKLFKQYKPTYLVFCSLYDINDVNEGHLLLHPIEPT